MAQALPDAAYADSQYSLLQLSTMAEQGDARAAYLPGTRYASGRAGVRDDNQAVRSWSEGLGDFEPVLLFALAAGLPRGVTAKDVVPAERL